MYDAIVVGARRAAATALLLARQGNRVLLVDRATFLSDTWRLRFIQPPGVARLRRWGLLETDRFFGVSESLGRILGARHDSVAVA